MIIKIREILLKYGYNKIFLSMQKAYILFFRTIHPYNLILHPCKLWNSSQELKSFRDINLWKECFIIWWAPSLLEMDLSKLNESDVISVNKWHLLKKLWLLSSRYHIISDDFCNSEIKKKYFNFSQHYFFSYMIFPKTNNFTFFKNKISPSFQNDISSGISNNWTVILPAIQLAKYMWYKKIYLLWVDLTFNIQSSHFYKESPWESFRTIDHSIMHISDMLKAIQSYNTHLKQNNIKLINLSPLPESLPWIEKADYNTIINLKVKAANEKYVC